jgi:type IV pilus assembly protein PilY1
MVAFGTGADMTVADRNNGITQTIYAVLDNTRYENDPANPGALKIITAGRGACTPAPDPDCVPAPSPVGVGQEPALLWNQTVNVASATAGTGASAGLTFWNLGHDHAADTVDWTTQKGWFMNLPARGERLLTGLSFYDGGNILQAYTQVPATSASNADEESCTGGGTPGRQFLTLINIMDGKPPTAPLMDLSGDHFYNPADYGVSASRGVARVELSPGAVSALRGARATMVFNGDANLLLRAMPETPARPSWRQIQ